MIFIGFTGGSGSGKTTIAKNLERILKDKALIIHSDNYQKFDKKLSKTSGMKNWDHPNSIDWKIFYKDLKSLKNNKSVTIKSREQNKLKDFEIIKLKPRKIIIIEGYLLFYKKYIRNLLDARIYLEANDKTRIKRRTKFKNRNYINKVLMPMHYKFIEPTKKYADLILDTEILSIKKCCDMIIDKLKI